MPPPGSWSNQVEFRIAIYRGESQPAGQPFPAYVGRHPAPHYPGRTPMPAAPIPVALAQIGQVAHTVKDLEPAVAFFRDKLGVIHLFTAGQLAFFDCAGTRLMVDALPEAQGNGNSVLYFKVDDIHGSVTTLRGKGVGFEGEPHRIFTHPDGTEEWMAFFKDPEGNLLSLMSQVKP
jgi:catechol 2,3-dioxygenase-like lactoylglutathione lyase family enzyme